MFSNAFNKAVSWGKDLLGIREEKNTSADRVLDQTRTAIRQDLGKAVPHQVRFEDSANMGGALGRCHSNGLVELAEHLTGDRVELFVTYYHELLHAAGIKAEGVVEGLAQAAARLNGFVTKGVAYAEKTAAFEEISKVASSKVEGTRAHFQDLLHAALQGTSVLQTRAANGLRKRGVDAGHASAQAAELLKKAA